MLVTPLARVWARLWALLRPTPEGSAGQGPGQRLEPALPAAAPFLDSLARAAPVQAACILEEDAWPAAPPHDAAHSPAPRQPAEAGAAPAAQGLVLYAPPPREGAAAEAAFDANALANVPETIEADLLTALRRFRSLSQVAVIRFNDMPTICVVSATEMFYSLISLQGLYQAPRSSLTPARVSIARNSHHGRTEAQSYYKSGSQTYFVTMVGAPLKHLFWVATLRCGDADEVARYAGASFHFKVWPDLVQLPHESQHVTWCGILARGPVTLAALAKSTGHSLQDAAVFLAACDELGILERRDLAHQLSGRRLALTHERSSERAGVLHNVLNRLRLARP